MEIFGTYTLNGAHSRCCIWHGEDKRAGGEVFGMDNCNSACTECVKSLSFQGAEAFSKAKSSFFTAWL